VSATRKKTDDPWSDLSRSELIALGRRIVIERLESLGCTVQEPKSRIDSKLEVRTQSGRSLEMFVSTQRLGGYVFWTKRRMQPAGDRFAAVVLLADDPEPALYLVPSEAWLDASAPLKDRPNIGKRSEPEYGISVARSSLPALERFAWNESADRSYFA